MQKRHLRSLRSTLVLAGVLAAVPMLGGCGGEPAANAATGSGTPASKPAEETTPPAERTAEPSAVALRAATWIVYTLPG